MIYNTSIINRQNTISAIEKSYALFYNYFYFDNRTEIIPNYHFVKYTEKKGFFKEEKVFMVDTLKIVSVIILKI